MYVRAPVYVTTGGVASSLNVSETRPELATTAPVDVVVTVTPHDLLYVPSVETVSSTQPFFVAVCVACTVGKPDQASVTGLVYQPFAPSGLAGVTWRAREARGRSGRDR